MTQIGNVPQIKAVKAQLDSLQKSGLIKEWEIPYENILTRLTAAIFFFTPAKDDLLDSIWKELSVNPMIHYRPNDEKKLSTLAWRVEFNKGFEL